MVNYVNWNILLTGTRVCYDFDVIDALAQTEVVLLNTQPLFVRLG